MKLLNLTAPVLLTSALLFAQNQTSTTQTTSAQTDHSAGNTSTSARNVGDGRYVLPAGTEIEVRVNELISSETSQQGDRFTGQVSSDLIDRDTNRVLIPRDAQVEGRVLSATPSGRLSSSGELQLSINTIRYGSSVMNVSVQPFIDKGESHTKSNTTKIGGGAALGAIIGAIAGGGKGAAIGAGVGGAAGAGAAAAGGKRPAEVRPEAILKFITAADTTVSAQPRVSSTTTSSTSRYPSASGSRQSTYPSSSTSSTSTDSNFPSPSSSATTPSSTSSSSDEAPVLQKRGGVASTTSTTAASTGAGSASGTAPNTGTYGSPTTSGSSVPATTASGTGTYGSSTTTTSPSSTSGSASSYPPNQTTTYPSTTAPTPVQQNDGRSFSARDRRVVNSCIRDHATSLPDSALRKIGVARSIQKGSVLSADVQRQLRALPLQCDRELPTLSNDLERVIYGGQVMLIDPTNRVIDMFEITQ